MDKIVEVSFANTEEGTEQWFVLFYNTFEKNIFILISYNRPLHFVKITVGNQVRNYLYLKLSLYCYLDNNKFIKSQTTY